MSTRSLELCSPSICHSFQLYYLIRGKYLKNSILLYRFKCCSNFTRSFWIVNCLSINIATQQDNLFTEWLVKSLEVYPSLLKINKVLPAQKKAQETKNYFPPWRNSIKQARRQLSSELFYKICRFSLFARLISFTVYLG